MPSSVRRPVATRKRSVRRAPRSKGYAPITLLALMDPAQLGRATVERILSEVF